MIEQKFLAAARRFAEMPRICMIDLVIALVLEFFAWPLLCLTSYVPLKARKVMPPINQELDALLSEADEAWQHDPQILELIGCGLVQRRKEMHRANRLALMVFIGIMVLNCLLVYGIVTSSFLGGSVLTVGWFCAMAFATLICVNNRHWTFDERFRRISR